MPNQVKISGDFDWRVANGSCGLNVGNAQVHGAYVNGIALFAFEDASNPGFFKCVVTGHMSCAGSSLTEAQQAGAHHALEAIERGDRKLTREQFEARMSSQERLPSSCDKEPTARRRLGPR